MSQGPGYNIPFTITSTKVIYKYIYYNKEYWENRQNHINTEWKTEVNGRLLTNT